MVLISGNPTTGYGSLMSNNCNNCTREAGKYYCSHRHTAQPSVTKEGQESNLYFPIKGRPRRYKCSTLWFLFCFSSLIQYDYPSEFKLKQFCIASLFLWYLCQTSIYFFDCFVLLFIGLSLTILLFFFFLCPLWWVFLWWFLR